MSRFSLNHRDVLELVDVFVLKKQYSSTSPPFDTRRVHSLRILADSISAIHPDAKAVVKSTVQSWVLKREKMKKDQSVSDDYWLNLEAELVRKWPRCAPLHVSSTHQPGSPADIPSPLLNPQVTSEPPQCGTRISPPLTEDLDADITPPQEPNRSCYGPSLGLPVPQMTSKSALSGTPIPVYHYGYTDKCGDKSLCYHYDDEDSTRVKVWHQNRSDKKETTGVIYYVCSSANCGGRAQVNNAGLYVSWAKPRAPGCRGEDRREFDCQQCLRYAKLLIRRGVSKMDAHGIAQDRAIALKCYDGLFPPYASMSKTYSKVEATRAISEPEVLKTEQETIADNEKVRTGQGSDINIQPINQ
uniref:Zf-3CxxC domain-containing protein n=1 Tax=Panagrellus redivivus TaxID=6233 RepID=A0A7E4W2E4_PANRE